MISDAARNSRFCSTSPTLLIWFITSLTKMPSRMCHKNAYLDRIIMMICISVPDFLCIDSRYVRRTAKVII